jgi:hypothetical protein
MRRSVIAALMFLLPMATVAQTAGQQANDSTCTAAMARSLTIRGIHLGMTTDELLALFPGASENPELKPALENVQAPPKFGMTQFYVYPRAYSTRERFAGVGSIYVTLFDDRVASYSVLYEGSPNGPAWNKLDEWIAKLSETLHLPGLGEWTQRSYDQTSKVLTCNGFQIVAGNQNRGGSISVSEENLDRKQQAREQAYQEKKRREFKP